MATAAKRRTKKDTGFHDRWLRSQLSDPEFKEAFERERREIQGTDAIVNALDHRRDQLGMSKAELARQIGKNPASVRRLLTASGNPEMRTVVAMADALDIEVKLVPRRRRSRRAARAA